MALTTAATIKTLLGMSDNSLDDVLAVLIPQADAIIKRYLQREIEQATYTEYYSGSGSQSLLLNQIPVQSIVSVHEDRDGYFGEGDAAFSSATTLLAGTDYVLRKDAATAVETSQSGILYRIGQSWPRPASRLRGQLTSSPGLSLGNIKVVYIAGWATIPADIQFAANRLVTSMLESRKHAGHLQSESIEDYSYSYSSSADETRILDSIKSALAPYKRMVI